jgi:hypothetical protein
MLTQVPSRGFPERTIESFFRTGTNERAVPDLTSVLRREPTTGPGQATGNPILTPVRTDALIRVPRVQLSQPPVRINREVGSGRIVIRNTDGQGVREVTTRTLPQVDRTQVRSQGSNPPPVVRREVERPVGDVQRVAPRPETVRPERPPASPRQRNDSVSWMRERQWIQRRSDAANGGASFQAPVVSRRDVQVRSYQRPYVAEPRVQARSVERQVQPRETFRTWSNQGLREPTARSMSAPSVSARSVAPHYSAPPRATGGGRPRR